MSDVTRILSAIEQGDGQAAEQLLPLVYDQLRKLAAAKLAHERPGQTLQPTALVHEAYLRLVAQAGPQHWDNSRHFFASAAVAMRRILVEQARRKHRRKRGGQVQRISLEGLELASRMPSEKLLELDAAIARLEREDPEKARVVELRFFAGMTHDEVAKVLNVATVTARRHWRYARAWLRRELHQEPETEESESLGDGSEVNF